MFVIVVKRVETDDAMARVFWDSTNVRSILRKVELCSWNGGNGIVLN